MNKSHSWLDMANLTHETQVMEFNFCLCEEQGNFHTKIAQEKGKQWKKIILTIS